VKNVEKPSDTVNISGDIQENTMAKDQTQSPDRVMKAVKDSVYSIGASAVTMVLRMIYTYVLSKKATDADPADAVSAGE
jgi:hypothetical protein